MINFRYNGNKYKMSFYPCGDMVRIEKIGYRVARDIKYNSDLKVNEFIKKLDKINFGGMEIWFYRIVSIMML